MQNKEQVYLYIKDEIDRISSAEEKKILDEAKVLEEEALKQMKAEAKQDAAYQLEKELTNISSQSSMESSALLEDRTKKLVEKREGYVNEIFLQAKNKLKEFADGPEYKDYLLQLVSKISQEYQMSNCILNVKESDLQYKDELLKAYALPLTVEVSKDIELGGFVLNNPETHVVVDESLDTSLENQKDWFYKTSGLMIK